MADEDPRATEALSDVDEGTILPRRSAALRTRGQRTFGGALRPLLAYCQWEGRKAAPPRGVGYSGAGTSPKRERNSCADTVSSRYVLSVARHIASPVTVSETSRLLVIPPRKCGPPESP